MSNKSKVPSARAFLFLWHPADRGFRSIGERALSFARLPSVGEIIGLGNDGDGLAADYKVVLVHQTPLEDKIDAELYAVRCDIASEVQSARPASDPSGSWKADSWPRFDD